MNIAHLGHVELRTPKLEESVAFFHDIVGLEISLRTDTSVYLRAWGDYEHYTLILTAGDTAGLVQMGLRVSAPEDVEAYAQHLESISVAVDRRPAGSEPELGESIRFIGEGGHTVKLYYHMKKWDAGINKSLLISQAQKQPFRGMNVKRLDHINLQTPDVKKTREFYCNELGFKLREYAVGAGDTEGGAWMAVTSQIHDVALLRQPEGKPGRIHHVAFYLDSREELLRTIDVLTENGHRLEAGPGKHGATQAAYTYFLEPGGNRIELFAGGYHIFAPDWEPVKWDFQDVNRAVIWWGAPMPDQFYLYDT